MVRASFLCVVLFPSCYPVVSWSLLSSGHGQDLRYLGVTSTVRSSPTWMAGLSVDVVVVVKVPYCPSEEDQVTVQVTVADTVNRESLSPRVLVCMYVYSHPEGEWWDNRSSGSHGRGVPALSQTTGESPLPGSKVMLVEVTVAVTERFPSLSVSWCVPHWRSS